MTLGIVSLTPLNERGPTVPALPTIYLQAGNGLRNTNDTVTSPDRIGSNASSRTTLNVDSSLSNGSDICYPDHVVLGRNRYTGIQDVTLSRQVCRVTVEICPTQKQGGSSLSPSSPTKVNSGVRIKLEVLKKQGDAPVTVNGEPLTIGNGRLEFVELKDGYVIGLQMHRMLYRVSTTTNSPIRSRCSPSSHEHRANVISCSEGADHSNPEVKKLSSSTQQALNQFRDEMMCSICMEVMVDATALQPCGHMYCGECASQLDRCPTCRRTLYGRMPIKQVDAMIFNQVKIGQTFDYEDALQYVKRSGSGADQFEWIEEKDKSTLKGGARKRNRNQNSSSSGGSPVRLLSPSREQRRRIDTRGNIVIVRSGPGTSGNTISVQNVVSSNSARLLQNVHGARSAAPASGTSANHSGQSGSEALVAPIISFATTSSTATSSDTSNGVGRVSLQFSPRRNMSDVERHLSALGRALSQTTGRRSSFSNPASFRSVARGSSSVSNGRTNSSNPTVIRAVTEPNSSTTSDRSNSSNPIVIGAATRRNSSRAASGPNSSNIARRRRTNAVIDLT